MSVEKEPQRIRLTLSPEAQRYVQADAPLDARLMAARGALPLPPIELATVLFALLHDPEAEVKARAQESLEQLPDGVSGVVLEGETHPALLSYLAEVFREREDRLEKLALNPHVDDACIAFLASLPHKRLVEIISNNQERMLRAPDIVEALGANLLTGRAVIDRILSFLGLAGKAAEGDEFVDPVSLSEAQTEEALRAVLGDEFGALASEFAREHVGEVDEESIKGNLFGAIQKMTVVQKIKIARLGNKEARSLLIRDRNKIVATAVITSPKLSDTEVVSYAQSRNVADEVLRVIATSRQWTRNYQVKLALAMNPKCPQTAALKFLNYLQDRDLKTIMKSKDVQRVVSIHARRILAKKGKA